MTTPETTAAPPAVSALLVGCDYAWFPHPPLWALKSAGYRWVGRYVSPEAGNDASGKNLIQSELHAIMAAGLELILFFESWATRMLDGHAAGVADAQFTDKITRELGLPGIPVYYSADFDVAPAQQGPVNDYLEGAASVRGLKATGVYGGYWAVSRALDARRAAYAAQTVAWSGGYWDPRAHVRQHLQAKVGGVTVDYDEATAADFGQWPRPGTIIRPTPIPTWQENMMNALPTIGHGDGRADYVMRAQALTNVATADPAQVIKVDGVFGPATTGAVQSVQAAHGLIADGIVGPRTWSVLVTGAA